MASGRDQQCCGTSYSVQDSPPQQRMIWPKMSLVVRLRNSAIRHDKCLAQFIRNVIVVIIILTLSCSLVRAMNVLSIIF